MKALINKMLVFAIASITLIMAGSFIASAQANSQLEEKTIPVGEFSGIDISGDFEVTLSKGDCSVRVATDKVLAPYVQVYVRGKVLYISYDSKAVPKDIRQLYKGRNASKPVFRASVSIEDLSSVSIRDNVSLTCVGDHQTRLNADIDLADKAQLKNLNINANSVNLSMKKNTQAAVNIVAASKAEVKAEGSASLKAGIEAVDVVSSAIGSSEVSVNASGTNATVSGAGSSKTSVAFNGEKAVVTLTGAANMELSGKGNSLSVRGEKAASLDAGAFDTKEAEINLNGPVKVNVTVSDTLDANLSGGSTLQYSGTPVFKIGKIVKSTLAPFGSLSR